MIMTNNRHLEWCQYHDSRNSVTWINILCPECGLELGTNNECKNCVDYQDYYSPDYYADRDAEAWLELFDRLWEDDPDR